MSKIAYGIEELIGNTPLMELSGYMKKNGISSTILGKLECFNPAGSVKDRVARTMLDDAESKGLIEKGSVIIEPTSGNTGIGLASIAASRGYRVILTMPESMSVERRSLLKAYGAELVLTDAAKGMNGAVEKAEELASEIKGSFIPSQFANPANPKAHYDTTGPELFNATNGKIDYFVAGIGTGGTISGVGKYLKEKIPGIKIIAVEPASSPLLSKGVSGPHKIQGIGANFVPEILDRDIYDEIIPVENEDAMQTSKELARTQGLLCGISSGAALYAAKVIAQREEAAGNTDKVIVAILPDSGERYLSTGMFE